MQHNNILQDLNLSYNNISDAGAVYISEALAVNDYLKTLDLSWNMIRPQGAVSLFKAVQVLFLLLRVISQQWTVTIIFFMKQLHHQISDFVIFNWQTYIQISSGDLRPIVTTYIRLPSELCLNTCQIKVWQFGVKHFQRQTSIWQVFTLRTEVLLATFIVEQR